MEWVASTLHTTLEHGVSSITTADAHTSAASSRLNWHPCWFKWTRPFCRKTKFGFCTCAITFQLASTLKCTDDHTMNWGHQWSVKNACALWQVYFFRISSNINASNKITSPSLATFKWPHYTSIVTRETCWLHTAAVSTVWSLLGPPWSNQAALYLFQKHLLC
jgi:hypothetical protein